MRLILLHAFALWARILGRPVQGVDAAEATRAGKAVALRFPSLVAALAEGHDVAVLVVDGADGWRRELGREEREADWPEEAWAPLRETVRGSAMPPGSRVVEAPLYPDGAPTVCGVSLAGRRASARDVIATIAAEWGAWKMRATLCRSCSATQAIHPRSGCAGFVEMLEAPRLTLTAVPSLVSDAAGIVLARDVKPTGRDDAPWWWAVEDETATRKRLGHDPRLLGEVEALASLPGLGKDGARYLVAGGKLGKMREAQRGHGSALCAVSAAIADPGVRIPGLNSKQMEALVKAGADGGAGILRAVALHSLRADVPGVVEMVAAWSRGEVAEHEVHDRDQGPGRAERGDRGGSGEGCRGTEPAGGRAGSDRGEAPREGVGVVRDVVRVGGVPPDRGGHGSEDGDGSAGQAVAPYVCPNCARGRCGGPHGDNCKAANLCKCNHGRGPTEPRGAAKETRCRCGHLATEHRDDGYGTSCGMQFCHCDRYEPKERAMTMMSNGPTQTNDRRPESPKTVRANRIRAIFHHKGKELAAVFPKDGPVLVARAQATALAGANVLNPDVTADSIAEAAIACHHLGLEIGDQAYLVPYKDKGTPKAKLMVGPRGLIALAYRSGFVKSIVARAVFDGDEFEYNLGTNEISHRKALSGRREWHNEETGETRRPRPEEAISHAYVMIETTTDGRILEVLTWEDIAFYRSFSKSETGPWFDNYEGMCRKTAIKRGLEFVPRSPLLSQALRETSEGTYELPDDLRAIVDKALAKRDGKAAPEPVPVPEDMLPAEESAGAAGEHAKVA